MALTADAIVEAAVDILDTYGLADLTMRRLADALDVKAGALYWHFPNKQALLAGIADVVLADLEVPPGAPAAQWAGTWARGLRERLLAHRDAAELVASTRAMNLGSIDPCATLRGRLSDTHSADDADATAQAFLHFVLGHVMEEQTQEQLVLLGVLEAFDRERSERHFTHGIALLTASLPDSE